MTIHLLYSWMALAGAAILWRNWLNDHPSWKTALHRLPHQFGKALTCGSCFTYWLSLFFLILVNPLEEWHLPLRSSSPTLIEPILTFAASWMILSWGALVGRFGYILLQERVAELVHAREGIAHHPH